MVMFALILPLCLTRIIMRKLTKEQIEMLDASGHVARMTDHYVYFKSSFINKFCREYHAGKTAEAILRENNIDPKVLGGTRVDSLRRHYNKEWLPRHVGIPERRTVTTNESYNNKLVHEIEYLRQEVEALKKILHADLEAKNIKD